MFWTYVLAVLVYVTVPCRNRRLFRKSIIEINAIINFNFQRFLAPILQQLETWDKKQQQDGSLV